MKYSLIFDFDSTIIKSEILENLASISLKDKPNKDEIILKIKEITNLGMEGKIPFSESLKRRISMLSITPQALDKVIKSSLNEISNSIKKNQSFFHQNSNNIYIISGGFKEVILPVAKYLGISKSNVFANTFIPQGKYLGVDTNNPLAKDNGKVKVVQRLNLNPKNTLVIGDGMSDYAIKKSGLANYFIAFIENVKRNEVVLKADSVANNMQDVINYLKSID